MPDEDDKRDGVSDGQSRHPEHRNPVRRPGGATRSPAYPHVEDPHKQFCRPSSRTLPGWWRPRGLHEEHMLLSICRLTSSRIDNADGRLGLLRLGWIQLRMSVGGADRADSSRASRFVTWKNFLYADVLPMVGGGFDGPRVGDQSFGRMGVLNAGGESRPPPCGRCEDVFRQRAHVTKRATRSESARPTALLAPHGEHYIWSCLFPRMTVLELETRMATTSERLVRVLKNARAAFRGGGADSPPLIEPALHPNDSGRRQEYDSRHPRRQNISGAGVLSSREAGGAIRVSGSSKTAAVSGSSACCGKTRHFLTSEDDREETPRPQIFVGCWFSAPFSFPRTKAVAPSWRWSPAPSTPSS